MTWESCLASMLAAIPQLTDSSRRQMMFPRFSVPVRSRLSPPPRAAVQLFPTLLTTVAVRMWYQWGVKSTGFQHSLGQNQRAVPQQLCETQPTALLFRSRIDSSSFCAQKTAPTEPYVTGGGWSIDAKRSRWPTVALRTSFFLNFFFSLSTGGGGAEVVN